MVEEVLVKEVLTGEMIEAGRALIQRLDESTDLDIEAAYWLYLPEVNRWRLMLASPQVGREGPIAAYGTIWNALNDPPDQQSNLSFNDISVIEPNQDLVAALRASMGTGNERMPVRLSRTAVQGRYIEDALIYRLGQSSKREAQA